MTYANSYSFPTDPAWWPGHACPECDGPDHPCDTCREELADSEAELQADGRRDER